MKSEKEVLKEQYEEALIVYDYYKGFDNIKECDKLKAVKGRLKVILMMCESRKINTLGWRKVK